MEMARHFGLSLMHIAFDWHIYLIPYLRCTLHRTLIGRAEELVTIHGSMRPEDQRKVQEAFMQDPEVQILVATDAAGEGINLHRAHLMVNYDLPWNPNRIEQRFGRIHRIGQTIDGVINRDYLQTLINENVLTHGIIDTTRLGNIREEDATPGMHNSVLKQAGLKNE